MQCAAEIVRFCRCNCISTLTANRSGAVSVIRTGVRCFVFGDGTAVILTNMPVSGSVIVQCAAEIVRFCRCNCISAFADNRSGTVSVIRAAVCAVALLPGVVSHIAALGSALMPVVGVVFAPIL